MPVSPELHDAVLKRDKCCFLFRLAIKAQLSSSDPVVPVHRCRDKWDQPHSAYDLSKLEVDHFHLQPGGVRGKRAPDTLATLVAMCSAGNGARLPHDDLFASGITREVREAEREYSRSLYG